MSGYSPSQSTALGFPFHVPSGVICSTLESPAGKFGCTLIPMTSSLSASWAGWAFAVEMGARGKVRQEAFAEHSPQLLRKPFLVSQLLARLFHSWLRRYLFTRKKTSFLHPSSGGSPSLEEASSSGPVLCSLVLLPLPGAASL